MASVLTWLDFSERERRKALDVIDQFRDEDTRDELGIGTVRDALADLLFPGISTIQTRARYFLFIPWIYKNLERRRIGYPDIRQRSRQAEVALIEALADSGEELGVIGFLSRGRLQRLPSNVYWSGLHLGHPAVRPFTGRVSPLAEPLLCPRRRGGSTGRRRGAALGRFGELAPPPA